MYRIIIADDHAVVTTGLSLIMEETPDLRIVDQTQNGNDLLNKVKESRYDLVLLDISMPGKDGFDVLKEIKIFNKQLPVVILTMNPEPTYALRMFQLGASAFIRKEETPEMIIHIIREVLLKGHYYSEQQIELITQSYQMQEPQIQYKLSNREFQILTFIASGLKKGEIAEKLNISKNTISNHRNNILKKLQLSNNSELTRYALQNGIIN